MKICWQKGYCPDVIVSKLESCAKRSGSKVVGFTGFEFSVYQSVLYSMLEFGPSYLIPESDAIKIIFKAAIAAGGKGKITADSLLLEIESLADEHMDLPLERYVLATCLSISSSASLPRLYFQGQKHRTQIIFESSLPEDYQEAAAEILAKASNVHSAIHLKKYLSTRIHISARSDAEAAEEALNLLAWVRGIWNLQLNRKTLHSIAFTDEPLVKKVSPVNKILLGPIHTLHRIGGELVPGKYWYESRYYAAREPYNPSTQNIANMCSALKYARHSYATSEYPEILREAMIRYARALDEWDWYNAFLGLWSILELLTKVGHDNYDVTIKRASFMFDNREYYRQILKHLRDWRNRIVHGSDETNEIRAHVYQLKLFVEQAIIFHLNHRFTSLNEAWNFLDLPDRKKALDREIELRKAALKYLIHI